MDEVIGLFPTPFMLCGGALDADTVAALRREAEAAKRERNAQTGLLSHTEAVNPKAKGSYGRVARAVASRLEDFGALLFGETLPWTIKEMWVNVLEPGGHQIIHTHSNSFISGVIFLTPSHPSARTVFHKSIGGSNFIFRHAGPKAETGPFNADKWVSPEAGPGDMILFPSYLLHEVPVNRGERRMTLAFNAIPDRLESWSYRVRFS
jgi:uncharacterized protein (TIGR02466 family)